MLLSLMSVATLFFFVAIAMIACALVGSLLFDLVPVLRNGDERLRQRLVFPQIADRPDVRRPAHVVRLTPASRPVPLAPLRAAA